MTSLRDARLKQALEHAPDAHMAPDARTRAAILSKAAAAASPVAAPVPGEAWWRRWLDRLGASGRPWNAAFATVLLACLVTLMWRDEEIPGAKMGDPPIAEEAGKPRAAAEGAAPSAALPATAAAPAPPAAAPATRPAPAAAPQAPAAQGEPAQKALQAARQRAQDSERQATAKKDAANDAMQEKAAPVLPPSREDERRRNEAPAAPAAPPVAAVAPAPVPVPSPAPPPAMASSPPVAAPAPPLPSILSDRAARQSAPAEAARADSARAAGELSAGAAAQRRAFAPPDISALDNWTQARISVDGRAVTLERAGADNLALQMRVLARAARSVGAMQAPVIAQVELLRGVDSLGSLAMGEAAVQWMPRGAAGQAFSGSLTAGQVQEFLAEARRLVR